jgi:chitosanase
MSFSERSRLIALAVVHIFETGKPLGDYSAVAVLDDGAGISYGINQFTHKSGSLLKVVQRYSTLGGAVGMGNINGWIDTLAKKTPLAITAAAGSAELKSALRKAAETPEMQLAQQQVMEEMYLRPAIEACEGSGFESTLALAVIYDSINHGSFAKIRDRVTIDRSGYPSNAAFERAWIKAYCQERLAWLSGARGSLKNTVYRPKFFLKEIEKANWDLNLPLNVNLGSGTVRLGESLLKSRSAATPVESTPISGRPADSSVPKTDATSSVPAEDTPSPTIPAQPVEVKKEEVPLYIKIGAVFTFLSGIGINAGTLAQKKLEELQPVHILYLVLALGLCYAAVWWFRKADKGAQNRTLKLMDHAADQGRNTVELKK